MVEGEAGQLWDRHRAHKEDVSSPLSSPLDNSPESYCANKKQRLLGFKDTCLAVLSFG